MRFDLRIAVLAASLVITQSLSAQAANTNNNNNNKAQSRTEAPKLQLLSMTKEAKPGGNVSVTVKAPDNANLKIEAQDVGIFQSGALHDQTVKNNQPVTWKWQIDKNYKANVMPVIVTADMNGKQDKLVKEIKIEQKNLKAEAPPVHIVKLNKQVALGETVSLTVKTKPGTKLKIEAQDAGMGQAGALKDQTADKKGEVTWNFKIDKNYKADKMPIIITSEGKNGDRKLVTAVNIRQLTAQKKGNRTM